MDFKDQITADMQNVFFNDDDFAYSAVYTPVDPFSPVVQCYVLIDFDSELRPENIDFGLVEVGITIKALYADVGEPEHGATFEIDNNIYRVARIDSNDTIIVTIIVAEVT